MADNNSTGPQTFTSDFSGGGTGTSSGSGTSTNLATGTTTYHSWLRGSGPPRSSSNLNKVGGFSAVELAQRKAQEQRERHLTEVEKARHLSEAGQQRADRPYKQLPEQTPFDQPQQYVYDKQTNTNIPIDFLPADTRKELLETMPDRFSRAERYLVRGDYDRTGQFVPSSTNALVGPTSSKLVKDIYETDTSGHSFVSGPVGFDTKTQYIQPPPAKTGLDLMQEDAGKVRSRRIRENREFRSNIAFIGPYLKGASMRATEIKGNVSDKAQDFLTEKYNPTMQDWGQQYQAEADYILGGLKKTRAHVSSIGSKYEKLDSPLIPDFSLTKKAGGFLKSEYAKELKANPQASTLQEAKRRQQDAGILLGNVPKGAVFAVPSLVGAGAGLLTSTPTEIPYNVARGVKSTVQDPARLGQAIGSAIVLHGIGKLGTSAYYRLRPPKTYYSATIDSSVSISGKGYQTQVVAHSGGQIAVKRFWGGYTKYGTDAQAFGLSSKLKMGKPDGSLYMGGFDTSVKIQKTTGIFGKSPKTLDLSGRSLLHYPEGSAGAFDYFASYGPRTSPAIYFKDAGGGITGSIFSYNPTQTAYGLGSVSTKLTGQGRAIFETQKGLFEIKGPSTTSYVHTAGVSTGKNVQTASISAGDHIGFSSGTSTLAPYKAPTHLYKVIPPKSYKFPSAYETIKYDHGLATATKITKTSDTANFPLILKDIQTKAVVQDFVSSQSGIGGIGTASIGLGLENTASKDLKTGFTPMQTNEITSPSLIKLGGLSGLRKKQDHQQKFKLDIAKSSKSSNKTLSALSPMSSTSTDQASLIIPAIAPITRTKQKYALLSTAEVPLIPKIETPVFAIASGDTSKMFKKARKPPKFKGKSAYELEQLSPKTDWLAKNIAEAGGGISMHPKPTRKTKRKYGHRVHELGAFTTFKSGGMLKPIKLKKRKKRGFDMKKSLYWDHTAREKKLISQFGGKPLAKYGYDGTIRGKPVEVRSCRKDSRFRLQKNVHNVLVRNNGSYIFDAPNRKPKRVSARAVSKKLGRGAWFKDRKYPHKFINKKVIWG